MNHGHPDTEQMQRYLARTLQETEAEEIEKHFNDCEECRARLGVIVQSKFGDIEEQLEGLTEQGREAAEHARNFDEKEGMSMSDNMKPEMTNPEAIKFRLENLIVEPPGEDGAAVADIEYRAKDQFLELDVSTRDGRTAVSIRFHIVDDTLMARLEYGIWTGKQSEVLPLIKIG